MKALLSILLCSVLSSPGWAYTLCIDDKDYLPYMSGEGETQGDGFMLDMLRLASEQNQQNLSIVSYPWRRCMDMLAKNQVDALISLLWLPEREQWAVYPKPSGQPNGAPDRSKRSWTGEYAIFVPLGSTLRFDGKTFYGINTGLSAPPGYVAWQRLKDAGVLNPAVLLPKAGLNLVALNRLDGYIVERQIGQHLLRSLGKTQQVTTLATPFMQDDWYLVFSRGFQAANPALTEHLWSSIAKIRDEQGQAMLESYTQSLPAQRAQ